MPKPFDTWTVLPHGELATVDDHIKTVVGKLRMPLGELPRRMTVVAIAGSRLVIWSAIALDERGMAQLEAFGRPAWLVVPSDKHRLDARIWKQRYPSMRVAAPPGARARVQKVVSVDTATPHFDDPTVQFVAVPGTGDREGALVVRGSSGTTLVLNDIVGNIRDAHGVGGWLLRVAGFAGDEPRVPKVVQKAMVEDKQALRQQLLQWSGLDGLARILVSHGEPIEGNAREALRTLAQSLD